MHADASEFAFGMMTENALAMDRLFRGHTQLRFPPDLLPLAERSRFTPESAAELEAQLWSRMHALPETDR